MKDTTNKDKRRLQQVKVQLSKHNYNYYQLDQPQISDYDYDQLFNELLQLEKKYPAWVTKDSPSHRVGDAPLEAFEKKAHRQPMLSLQNSYSSEDISAFDKRLKKFLKNSPFSMEYICEPKLDGLAIELVYENGILVHALTRGDGLMGELVTSNVKTIPSIPLQLKDKKTPILLEVRGEIIISKADFEKLNKDQEETGQHTFANPRNAAAGTIRQLDPQVVAARPLKMFSHSFGEFKDLSFTTQEEFLQQMDQKGLPTLIHEKFGKKPLIKKCRHIEEAIEHYHFIDSIRSKLDYNIDGLVIKVNSLSLQNQLGTISRSPRWASAVKFQPEQAQTVIQEITIQVGRTGAITPLATMEPVKVGGVTITHATLHNQDEIKKKDIRKGDTVIIQRAGDVIPEIVSVVKEKRKENSLAFAFPPKCPSCHSPLKSRDNEAILRCHNPLCPAIIKESLKHFVSKKAMNIDRLGNKLIEQFVDHGLIKTYSDIYLLDSKSESILNLERQGKKSVNNLIKSVSDSRRPQFDKFIYALGIRFVGEQTARSLSRHFKDIESLSSTTEEELLSIYDIGPKAASSLRQYFAHSNSLKELQKLQDAGVQIQYTKAHQYATAPLQDLSFVITGTFHMARNDIKDLITLHGGQIKSSISEKVDYLLAGNSVGSKLNKAESLGVPIIRWEEFQELLHST